LPPLAGCHSGGSRQPPDRRSVHAIAASIEATEGFLIVRRALEAIELAAKVVTLPPKLIALAKRHS